MADNKMNKQTSDAGQEKLNANQNKVHMTPKLKGFVTGVGSRPKSTKND